MSNHKHPILEIKNLCKEFILDKGRRIRACQNITLPVYRGETLGIIGESGCGKSTLVRTLLQLEKSDGGQALFQGQDILQLRGRALRESRKHIQMIFQNPTTAFNESMRVEDILTEPLENFGRLDKKDKEVIARELLALVDLPDALLYRYPQALSGGQRQRLGIARAISLEPDILICDEVTSALDVSVQDKICQLLARLQKEKGLSYIFICHDLALVDMMSHQIAVMYLGHIVEYIDNKPLTEETVKHPYTQTLLRAVLDIGCTFKPISTVPLGEDSHRMGLSPGCPFASRCQICRDICLREKPKLVTVEEGHQVACHCIQIP